MTKPTAYLDRLLWLPLEHVEWDRIQMDLRLMSDAVVGEGRLLEPWEMSESHIGVPRRWGLQRYGKRFQLVTRTVRTSRSWPKLRFPESWGYRSGQKQAREALVTHFEKGWLGGLLSAPCGSGKTLMGLDIASKLDKPVLVLVHKNDLAEQWHETLRTFWPEADGGHIQGNNWDYRGKHMVTAMAQTLYARRDSAALLQEMHNEFGMVITDEGHRYPADTFEYVLRSLPMHLRLGVSATWRRKDGMDCIWDWHVGEIVHKMTAERLSGKYVQPVWKTSLTDHMFKRGNTLLMAQMVNSIAQNVPFNCWLAEQIVAASGTGRRVLLCSDRVSQCVDVQERIRRAGYTGSMGLYVGAVPNGVTASGKPRNKRLTKSQLHAAKECDIVLATYGMMSEGTDIPTLDTLFFGTPRSDVEQTVGRIQRLGDKRELLIVDPVFQMGVCVAMANKRRAIYDDLEFEEMRS